VNQKTPNHQSDFSPARAFRIAAPRDTTLQLCRIKIIVWLGSDIRYDALAAILRRMSDPPGRGDQTAPNLIIR
jgi:hypothetical protein